MNIYKYITPPDCVTLLNVIAGVLAIFFIIQKHITIACYLILACVVFDFLDGKLARWFGWEHDFGAQLDSLADIISFGLAPAVLGFALLEQNWQTTTVLIFFVCCGILRLARFNIIKQKSKKRTYEGLPITFNGIIFPLAVLFSLKSGLLLIAYVLMGVLMISSIKIKKVL